MFKVPGWSVPADALKTQTKAVEEPATNRNERLETGTGKRKRKRKQAREDTVTAENVAELFHQYIESAATVAESTSTDAQSTKKTKAEQHPSNGKTATHPEADDAVSTKRKTLKEKKREKRARLAATEAEGATPKMTQPTENPKAPPTKALEPKIAETAKLTPLQTSMQQKLISSRFRHLNQTLYTTPSEASKTLFASNPGFFKEYHEGFRKQVSAWPENPIDGFITWIKVRGAIRAAPGRHQKDRKTARPAAPEIADKERKLAAAAEGMGPLPRDQAKGTCTIADLGCGDGQLAGVLCDSPPRPSLSKKLRLSVRSFDLASNSPHVEVSDISALPLESGSVDVAIFCLALMGTNWVSFVEEAYRILRWRGECWVSEVSSRFGPSVNDMDASHGKRGRGDETKKSRKRREEALEGEDFTKVDEIGGEAQASTDVSAFVQVLNRRGFEIVGEPEMNNKMFVRMRFVKTRKPIKGKEMKKAATTSSWTADKRFLDDAEISEEAEARVLKPCVYKQR